MRTRRRRRRLQVASAHTGSATKPTAPSPITFPSDVAVWDLLVVGDPGHNDLPDAPTPRLERRAAPRVTSPRIASYAAAANGPP